mmetsp:Transcript_65547/g.211414  ORF Transcript_65547/g.211414 Transcript_65547/m.211414 type:complete len:260 (-) Transcript_65547:786-1565(-)
MVWYTPGYEGQAPAQRCLGDRADDRDTPGLHLPRGRVARVRLAEEHAHFHRLHGRGQDGVEVHAVRQDLVRPVQARGMDGHRRAAHQRPAAGRDAEVDADRRLRPGAAAHRSRDFQARRALAGERQRRQERLHRPVGRRREPGGLLEALRGQGPLGAVKQRRSDRGELRGARHGGRQAAEADEHRHRRGPEAVLLRARVGRQGRGVDLHRLRHGRNPYAGAHQVCGEGAPKPLQTRGLHAHAWRPEVWQGPEGLHRVHD